MADRSIDLDEIRDYSARATAAIAEIVKGRYPVADAALDHCAAALATAAEAVRREWAAARTAEAGVRRGTATKAPGRAAAHDALRRFRRHLLAHPRGSVDLKRFFTKDGTLRGIGNSTPKVLQALAQIAAELGKPGSAVQHAAAWQAELHAAAESLAAAAAETENAQAARRGITPALNRARADWNRIYGATKSVVEGVLRLSDGLGLLPHVFPDLAVPARRRRRATAAEPDSPPAT